MVIHRVQKLSSCLHIILIFLKVHLQYTKQMLVYFSYPSPPQCLHLSYRDQLYSSSLCVCYCSLKAHSRNICWFRFFVRERSKWCQDYVFYGISCFLIGSYLRFFVLSASSQYTGSLIPLIL
jgi:hypothetical protein